MPKKTTVVACPFALFGSPGAAQGPELLADALRELIDDNRREERPTRSRAYQPHLRLRELEFASLPDVSEWRDRARRTARQILRAGDFLLWLGSNHLSALPVYEEFGGLKDTLVIQFDAHLDLYNLSDNPAEPNHGNFLRFAEGHRPRLINVGHRDLFLRANAIAEYYEDHLPQVELARRPEDCRERLRAAAAAASRILLDIDCDVLDPAFFPATAHPVPFGLAPTELLGLIETVWSDRVVGVCVSEFDPGRDREDRSLSLLIWLIEHLLLRRYE